MAHLLGRSEFIKALVFGAGICGICSSVAAEALFAEKLTVGAVAEFIRAHPSPPDVLRINSMGGDVAAGMNLGEWVYSNKITVVVELTCQSACANYVLPAAPRKIIPKGAIVSWHGSMEDEQFKTIEHEYEQAFARVSSGLGTPDDSAYLEKHRDLVSSLVPLRDRQRAFYKKIGVCEEITRLGDSPTSYGVKAWFASAKVMNAFGIGNVQAEPAYPADSIDGSTGWMIVKFVQGGKYLWFDMGDNGDLYAYSSGWKGARGIGNVATFRAQADCAVK